MTEIIFEDMYYYHKHYEIVALSEYHEHVKYVQGVEKIKYKYTFLEYLHYLYGQNENKNLQYNQYKCILSNKQFVLFQALQDYANLYL
jgi:hypothetical protein